MKKYRTQNLEKPPHLDFRSHLVGLLRVFSIHERRVFPILVAGLAVLSIGAWWSVNSSVESNIHSRLDSEAARIETAVHHRLDDYENVMINVRSHFLIDGIPNQKKFNRSIVALDVPKRFPGVRTLGFAKLNTEGENVSAPISLVAHLDWMDSHALGYDILSEPLRRQTALKAVRTHRPMMSPPLELASNPLRQTSAHGFIIYLPVFKNEATPHSTGRLDEVSGFLFATFKDSDFFEGAFGAPSLNNEHVNFSIHMLDLPPAESLLYDRFNRRAQNAADWSGQWASSERVEPLLGRRLQFTVTPLEHFYTAVDLYLPTAVAVGAVLMSMLVLLVLKASQAQLLYETKSKELSLLAMARSRNQTERLKKLNDFAKTVSSELDLDALVNRLFDLVTHLVRSDGSLFYFTSYVAGEAMFSLRGSSGVFGHRDLKKLLSPVEIATLLPDRPVRRKANSDLVAESPLELEHLFSSLKYLEEISFSDWYLIGIPSREMGLCGLLFLSRTDRTVFEELEVELIESVVAQAARAIENAQLFRKVAEAGRAKNAFLANMSHEIRTPLNGIIGFSEILAQEGVSNVQKANFVHGIRKGSQQLTRIIDDILDLSKIESGKLFVDKKPLSIASLLSDLRALIQLRSEEKRLSFSIESIGQLPSQIETDEVRLKQILTNLLGNAIKFTEVGSIQLTVRYLKGEQNANLISFRIVDTGIGISKEAQRHLFEPFTQADDSKTRKYGGSGLGLALSKRLCIELGGDLRLVKSGGTMGCEFEATIEVGDVSQAKWFSAPTEFFDLVEFKAPIEPLLHSAKILLVEDSIDNQEIFQFFLETAGAEVEIVESGLRAVSCATKTDFDLILMDIQITEIDGKEATRRLRKQGYMKPIITLTAHAMREERESCLRAGCDGQITKPVSGPDLINDVHKYLRRNHESVPEHFKRNEGALFGAPLI